MENIEYLCDFIIDNCNHQKTKKIISEESYCDIFEDIDLTINTIIHKLNINKNDIDINMFNMYKQYETVISFKYNNRVCEFYEIKNPDIIDEYNMCVRLMPVFY